MSSAGAPPERDVEVISPLDQRVYTVKPTELDAYKKAGWITAQAEAGVDTPEIRSHFDGWTGAGKSSMVSFISGIPFLNTAISHLSTAENAKWWAENVKAAEDEHPYLDMASRVAGTGAALVGGAAIAGLAAPAAAVGLGAEALGAGALGAEAAGAGGAALAGGAEAAGSLAAAAGEGAGAALETGAGNWLSTAKTALGGEKLAGVAARGAAANVALGQVARIDDASIRHALDPDGQEKLSFSLGDVMFDAVLGGGTSLVLGKTGQWLGKMGKYLDSDGLKKLTDAMFEEDKQLANKLAGRDAEFYQAATELVGKPRDEVRRILTNRKDVIEKSMNGMKAAVRGQTVGPEEWRSLYMDLQAQLGGTEAWEGSRGIKNMLLKAGARASNAQADVAAGKFPRLKTPHGGVRAFEEPAPFEAPAAPEYEGPSSRTAKVDPYDLSDAAAPSESPIAGRPTTYYDVETGEKKFGIAPVLKDAVLHSPTSSLEPTTRGTNFKPKQRYDQLTGKLVRNETQEVDQEATQKLRDKLNKYLGDTARERGTPNDLEKAAQQSHSAKLAEHENRVAELKAKHAESVSEARLAHAKRVSRSVKGEVRLDVEQLQKIRRIVQAKTTWGDVTARESNAQFKAGGERITKAIHGIFEKLDPTEGKQMAQEWATLDKNYSVNELLRDALKSGKGAAPMGAVARSVMNAGGVGAAIGGTLKATMGYGGGAVTGAVFAAGTKAAYMLKPEHFAKATRLLGKVFVEADNRLVGAVEQGLYGAPQQFHNVFHPKRYQELAAKIAMARGNPDESFANSREELSKAGIPDTIADDIATRHHAIRQYLGDQLPKNTVTPGVVTRGHGDPVQQRAWLGQAETARNPAYGIANPTPANLEVLRQFYPHNLYQAQQAAETHVQGNPHLPLAAKMYASRLAGRPLTVLATQAFGQSLAGARQKQQQQAQQQSQGRGTGGRKAVSSGQGSGTRLDGLQNGGA